MPPAPERIIVVDQKGQEYEVSADGVQEALDRGWRVQSDEGRLSTIATGAHEESAGGVRGTIGAFGAGALSGLTLGASDAAIGAIGGEDARTQLRLLRQVNPGAATAGQIAGALVPVIPGAGASALVRASPAGLAARAGTRIAAEGAEAGLAARAGYAAAGGALEGAAQNTGAYLSEVALGNKELSADAFIGAMGNGALYGGVAGGALSIASSGVTAARKLLPKEELTPAAVRKVEQEAASEVATAIDDSRELERAARARLRQIREERAVVDLATKRELDAIAVAKARELADATTKTAAAKAEAAAARAERAKAGPGTRKRSAFSGEPSEIAAGATEASALDDEIRDAIRGGRVEGERGPFTDRGLDLAVARERARRAAAPPVADEIAPPAAVAPAPLEEGDDLMRALQNTKAGLDSGKSIADLSAARRETFVEDALNAHVAQSSDEARRLLEHVNELSTTRDAMAAWIDKYPKGRVKSIDYAEGMRKQTGYASVVPEGEGVARLPRGRMAEWRGGDDAARAAADARITAKVTAEDIVAGDDAAAALAAKWSPKNTAREIVESTDREALDQTLASLDDQVGSALRSKVDDVDDDLDDVISTISRFEQRIADAADDLGAAAPPRAAGRAKGYRDAQGARETAADGAAAAAIEDLDKAAATISLGGEPPAAPGRFAAARGALDKASKAGEVLEALSMMGVGVPDPGSIPVIGPLLSAVLKGKLGWRVLKKMGGVSSTAETTIASKSAAVQQRVYSAIDKALELSGKGLARASRSAALPTTAAVLGHKLFDDGEPQHRTAYSSKAKSGALDALYTARADELTRALQPGAVRAAVRARIRTSDPQILNAVIAAEERKLTFLAEKLPRPAAGQGLLDRRSYVPSTLSLATFSRYVQAANDPASVLEHAAAGRPVSREAAEALRVVYPNLMEAATRRLIERSAELKKTLPLARKMALSTLVDLPLDQSMEPTYAAFLQEGYQAPPPAQQPAPPMGTPTIASDVAIGVRVDPQMEGAIQ